jgi:hypothetical protein
VLHDDDEDEMRGESVQQAQEHRIPDRPDGIRPQGGDGAVEVDPAVGVAREPGAPDQQEVDPQQQSSAEQHGQRDERAVTRETLPRSI